MSWKMTVLLWKIIAIIIFVLFFIWLFLLIKKSNMQKRKIIFKRILIIILLLIISIFLIIKDYNYYTSYLDMSITIFKVFFVSFLIWFINFFIKLDSNKKKKIFTIFLIICIIVLIFFAVDYTRVANQKSPVFCTNFGGLITYQDGGTSIYFGLGYKVISFNTRITYNTNDEMVWDYYTIHEFHICPYWVTYEEALDTVKQKYTIP